MLLPLHPKRNLALEEDADGGQPLSHTLTGLVNHDDLDATSAIPSHPFGIKPLGNKYFSGGDDARKYLGTFQVLPDEMLMQLIEYLDARTLRLLGYTCRFLFACSMSDDVWKTIFLE